MFPSLTQIRSRAISNSPASPSKSSLSSPSPSQHSRSFGDNSEAGSPLLRRRVNGVSRRHQQHQQAHERARTVSHTVVPVKEVDLDVDVDLDWRTQVSVRAPMSRLTSSATLFFGPAIPSANPTNPSSNPTSTSRDRSHTRTSNVPSPSKLAVNTSVIRPGSGEKPSLLNRHSYAGFGSTNGWTSGGGLRASPSGSESPSPRSDCAKIHRLSNEDDDDDMFFDVPKDSSFVFSVTEGTPSPRKHSGAGLKKKYKPRDSGVVVSDDEGNNTMSVAPSMEFGMRKGGTLGASGSIGGLGDYLSVMPRASTSVNSIYSDVDLELVTPGYGPGEKSGWPDAYVVADGQGAGEGGAGEGGVDVDAFILRTLAAATQGPKDRRGSEGLHAHHTHGDGKEYGMKIPGTPVKKVKGRLWQSAAAAKVGGLGFDLDLGLDGKGGKGGKGMAPRKSMPAVFSWKERGGDTESEGEEDSPSFRRDARYEGLGIGKPGAVSGKGAGAAFSKPRWLIRRSSSGIFSGGSDVSVGTPTKGQGTKFIILFFNWINSIFSFHGIYRGMECTSIAHIYTVLSRQEHNQFRNRTIHLRLVVQLGSNSQLTFRKTSTTHLGRYHHT